VCPRAVLAAVVKRKIPSPGRESNPRTPIVRPVAQRCTDWAITALVKSWRSDNTYLLLLCVCVRRKESISPNWNFGWFPSSKTALIIWECLGVLYEGVSKSFQIGLMEEVLQMLQLSATRCSCIAVLWVGLVSFAAITFCVASQRMFIVVYFVMTQFGNLWIHSCILKPSYYRHIGLQVQSMCTLYLVYIISMTGPQGCGG
jgi:hypothetical protein